MRPQKSGGKVGAPSVVISASAGMRMVGIVLVLEFLRHYTRRGGESSCEYEEKSCLEHFRS